MRPGGEHLAQNRGDPLRFVVYLLFAKAKDLKPPSPQLEVAAPIVPKSLTPPVIAPAIGLYRKPTVAIEEVDQISTDPNVDLGHRQTMPTAKAQEVPLEVAASTVVRRILHSKTEHVRLSDRPSHLGVGQDPAQVPKRAGRRRDRNAVTARRLRGMQVTTSMQADPVPLPPSAGTSNRDVYWSVQRLEQVPQNRCAAVADDRPRPTCENGCHPPAMQRDPGVPSHIDTSMDSMQPTAANASQHRVVAQPGAPELVDGNHTVLSRGHASDELVTLFGYTPNKVTRGAIPPYPRDSMVWRAGTSVAFRPGPVRRTFERPGKSSASEPVHWFETAALR